MPIGKIIIFVLILFFVGMLIYFKKCEDCGIGETILLSIIFTIMLFVSVLIIIEMLVGLILLWNLII